MVAGTFDAYVVTDGVRTLSENATVNGAAGSISLFFILFAVIFGVVQHKVKFTGWKEIVFGLVCTVLAFVCGMNFPVILGKDMWIYIAFVYIFLAAVLPMWFVMQPRDYMSTFMFVGMIAGAVLGLIFAHPDMNLPAFTGFQNESGNALSDSVCNSCLRRCIRIPQPGIFRYFVQDNFKRERYAESRLRRDGSGKLLAVIALCVAGRGGRADGTAAVELRSRSFLQESRDSSRCSAFRYLWHRAL